MQVIFFGVFFCANPPRGALALVTVYFFIVFLQRAADERLTSASDGYLCNVFSAKDLPTSVSLALAMV